MTNTAFTTPRPCRSVANGRRIAVTAAPLIQTGVESGRVSFANGGATPKRAMDRLANELELWIAAHPDSRVPFVVR